MEYISYNYEDNRMGNEENVESLYSSKCNTNNVKVMNPYIQMGRPSKSRVYNFDANFSIKDDSYVQPKLNICSGFSDEFMADCNEDENVPDSCRESLKHRHFNVGIMQEVSSDQVNDSVDIDHSDRKKEVLHMSTKIK